MHWLKRIWRRPELTMGAAKSIPDSVHRPYQQVAEAQGWNIAPGRCCPNCGEWVSGP